jgi:hypothetical protein
MLARDRSRTDRRGPAPAGPSESIAGAGEALEGVSALIAFWDEVNREDIAIVERVQQGLADPAYTGGRMCYRFEESVHRFQNMVIDRMLGVRRVPAGDEEPRRRLFPDSRSNWLGTAWMTTANGPSAARSAFAFARAWE